MEILLLSTFNISFCTKCSSDFSSLYELASPMFCIFLHQLWPRWKRHPLRIAVGQDILKPSIAPWIADWGKNKIKNYLVIRASISQPHRIRAWSSLKGTQFIRFFRTELRLSQSILSLSLSHAQSLVYIGTYEYLSLSLFHTPMFPWKLFCRWVWLYNISIYFPSTFDAATDHSDKPMSRNSEKQFKLTNN